MQSKNRLFTLCFIAVAFLAQYSCAQKSKEQKQATNHINFSTFNHTYDISSGHWFATLEEEEVCLMLMDAKNRNNPSFMINFCVPKEEFQTAAAGEGFKLIRESGTLVFKGGTLGTKEAGDFTFSRNDNFESFLKTEGISTTDKDRYSYFKLFLGNITRDYVEGIKEEGFKPSLKELGKLGIHQVSLDYIRALGDTQYKGMELNMISKFAIHGVTIKYIEDLKAAGYGHIDAGMVKKFAIHGVSVAYINELSKLGYGNLEPNLIKNFVIHGISAKYIKSLADVGYRNLSPNMLKNFAVHNIDAAYIQSLKKTGIRVPEANTIKKARVHNLKATDIKRAMANGHDSNELSDYIKLKIHGK